MLKRRHLEICEHSSFFMIDEIAFKSNSEFRNLKITKLSLLIKQ